MLSFTQGVIFYLHGKIVEEKGTQAVDTTDDYCAHQYEEILPGIPREKIQCNSDVSEKGTRKQATQAIREFGEVFN